MVSLAKGIERGTLLRMTEVTLDVLTGHDPGRVAVLTGPNLAREVAEGQPAASVIACRDEATARQLQQLCMSRSFRVYTNPDVVGCEVAGAMKNVIAIAAGHRGGARLRRQHAGGADHSRPGRGRAARRRPRR